MINNYSIFSANSIRQPKFYYREKTVVTYLKSTKESKYIIVIHLSRDNVLSLSKGIRLKTIASNLNTGK